MPRLIVTGHARHGKDTVCHMLQKHGLLFQSSSKFVNEKVVFPILSQKYGYSSLGECYSDRVNHREEWFNLIAAYNTEDKARLGREIFKQYDIYCGLRNREELLALKEEKTFDFAIWVDASKRLPPEDSSSITITKEDCTVIISNNGNLADLEETVSHFYHKILLEILYAS